MENENITREVMEQYEAIRQMGLCNMYDFGCVQDIADRMCFFELASLEGEDYLYILGNFTSLMKKFNVSQERKANEP